MNSKKNNKNSPVLDSVAPTTGPDLTQPQPKTESDKRTEAAKAGSTKDSDPTM